MCNILFYYSLISCGYVYLHSLSFPHEHLFQHYSDENGLHTFGALIPLE